MCSGSSTPFGGNSRLIRKEIFELRIGVAVELLVVRPRSKVKAVALRRSDQRAPNVAAHLEDGLEKSRLGKGIALCSRSIGHEVWV